MILFEDVLEEPNTIINHSLAACIYCLSMRDLSERNRQCHTSLNLERPRRSYYCCLNSIGTFYNMRMYCISRLHPGLLHKFFEMCRVPCMVARGHPSFVVPRSLAARR